MKHLFQKAKNDFYSYGINISKAIFYYYEPQILERYNMKRVV